MASRRWNSLVVPLMVVCGAASSVLPAFATDAERDPPGQNDSLQMVLDRIGTHVETNAWRKPGWKDPDIEQWLEKLVASIAAGTENNELKLPVKFADVSTADPMPPLRENALILGRDIEIPFAQKAIIMSDGVAKVSHAQDCIIVARSVAAVAHARRCLIIAGSFVHVSHDGSRDGGSVVVSRGFADISHAHGSHVFAGEGITISHATDTVFINSQVQADRGGSKRVVIKNLPLESFVNDPLRSKLEVLGVVRPGGAVFRFAGKRYIAECGQPISDEAGAVVESLKGWQLAYAGQGVAVFSRNGKDAVIKHDIQ